MASVVKKTFIQLCIIYAAIILIEIASPLKPSNFLNLSYFAIAVASVGSIAWITEPI